MPGITDPSEEYFKDGLWAWVTDQWKKLTGDDAGHLQVDVVESGLPSGAANSANQTTMITALQLIDDLRASLNSVATDELDIVIDGQSADVEITQTAAADLTPGIKGWDGSAWRKLPLVWGYSDRYAEYEVNVDAAEGANTLTGSTVPSGEAWIVTSVMVYNGTSAFDGVSLELYDGSIPYRLRRKATVAVNEEVIFVGNAVLKSGDCIRGAFWGCVAGDVLRMYILGYKMKVAE